MKRSEAYPSTYLSRKDLAEDSITVVIDKVEMATLKSDRGEEEKPVLYFQDDAKPMVLNNANWITIEEAYGEDSADWYNKPIEVYDDPSIMFGGKRVGGVRVRIPKGAGAAKGGKPAAASGDLTFDAALAMAAEKGIDKNALIAALKAAGKAGWKNSRDTAWLREYLAGYEAPEQSFGDSVDAEDQEQPLDTDGAFDGAKPKAIDWWVVPTTSLSEMSQVTYAEAEVALARFAKKILGKGLKDLNANQQQAIIKHVADGDVKA